MNTTTATANEETIARLNRHLACVLADLDGVGLRASDTELKAGHLIPADKLASLLKPLTGFKGYEYVPTDEGTLLQHKRFPMVSISITPVPKRPALARCALLVNLSTDA